MIWPSFGPEVRQLEMLIDPPDVAIALPSTSTLTAAPGIQFQVDYGTSEDPVDLSTFRFSANGVDWSSRFDRQTLMASFTAPVSDLVGGPLNLKAEAAHGPELPVAKVSRLLLVRPKFHDVTRLAEPGIAITVEADGLDPDPAKNILNFSASGGSRIDVPFATVTLGEGTVVVPNAAGDGLVRLIVNGIPAIDEYLFKVSLPVPSCGSLPVIFRQLADSSWVVSYTRRTEAGSDPRCPAYLAPPNYRENLLVRFPSEGGSVVLWREFRNDSVVSLQGVYPNKRQDDIAYIRKSPTGQIELVLNALEAHGRAKTTVPLPGAFWYGGAHNVNEGTSVVGDFAPDGSFYFLGADPNGPTLLRRVHPNTGAITSLPTTLDASPQGREPSWLGVDIASLKVGCDGFVYVSRSFDGPPAPWYSLEFQVQKLDPLTGQLLAETGWRNGWVSDMVASCDTERMLLSIYIPPFDGYVDPDAGAIYSFYPPSMSLSFIQLVDDAGADTWYDEGNVFPAGLTLSRQGKVYWETYNWGPNQGWAWKVLPEDFWVPQNKIPPCLVGDTACPGALPYCTAPLLWPGEQPGEGTQNAESGGSDPDQGPQCARGQGPPTDVITGAVFFSQTDAVLSGIRTRLPLTRSYNSRRAAAGKTGSFGLGWEWSIDKRIFINGTRNVSTRVRHRGLEFREQLEESGPGLAS